MERSGSERTVLHAEPKPKRALERSKRLHPSADKTIDFGRVSLLSFKSDIRGLQQRSSESQARIIQAASQAFTTRGYDDIATYEIAAAAAVAQGLIAYHFESIGSWCAVPVTVRRLTQARRPTPPCSRRSRIKRHLPPSASFATHARTELEHARRMLGRLVIQPQRKKMRDHFERSSSAAISRNNRVASTGFGNMRSAIALDFSKRW